MKKRWILIAAVFVCFCMSCVLNAKEGTTNAPAGSVELQRLKQGNERFVSDAASRPDYGEARRQGVASGEVRPFAVVLACSDAGASPEMAFDAKLGDLVVVRTTAACVTAGEAAALEHATLAWKLPLLVVMGHSNCRLLREILERQTFSAGLNAQADGALTAVAVTRNDFPGMHDDGLLEEATRANVWESVERLFKFSACLRGLVLLGRLQVVGAFYDTATGRVEWLGRHPDERTVIKLYNTPSDIE